MRNTNNHEKEGNGIRKDRIVIVDQLLLEDDHDRPLCTNFGPHSGEFSTLRANNLGNQRVRDRLSNNVGMLSNAPARGRPRVIWDEVVK